MLKKEYSENLNHEEDIDLLELLHIIYNRKWIIILLTTLISISGLIYSLSLPNIYESRALLVSSSDSDQSGLMQTYGGLAGLAGIDLSGDASDSNAVHAIEKLNSLSFFENDFLPNIFLPNLMAYKSWDIQNNISTYDEKIYDSSTKSWVREYSYPQKLEPSAQESFKEFKDKHLSLSFDKKNGFVTIVIKHQSPYIAKQWTELIVDQINSFYRKKDKKEAETAAKYLNELLSQTSLSEMKQVLASLLQKETQKLTLIEANEFYVYEYIDPPAVMERKSEPSRSLILILAVLFGGILSVLTVLIKHYLSTKNRNL